MKRIFALFLTFVFLFVCASCTERGDGEFTTALQSLSQSTTQTAAATVSDISDTTEGVTQADTSETSKTKKTEKATVSSKKTEKTQTTKAAAQKQTKKVTTKKTTTKKQTTKKPKTTLPQADTTSAIKTESTTCEPDTTSKSTKYCTISICCKTATENSDKLKSGKEQFIPSDGYILHEVKMSFTDSETAFDLLKRACEENTCTDNCEYCRSGGIQYEASYNPAYQSGYVEGIHQLYEKDCGSRSGWMYRVNGVFPNYGSSSYVVSDGDRIEWIYTCDLGDDIGA